MIHRLEQILYRYSKERSRRNLYPWLAGALAGCRVGPEHRVLNIGAGGEVEAVLVASGLRVISVDVDAARRPDIVASAENLGAIRSDSCDAIVCSEVLEHVVHPEKAVDEIFRILKPGGTFIGSTPFLLGIHDAPNDYRRYTLHGLRRLLSSFSQVEIRERNAYFAAVAVLISRPFAVGSARQRRTAALLSPLLVPLCMLVEALDRVLACPDGTTGYFFVARKPAPE